MLNSRNVSALRESLARALMMSAGHRRDQDVRNRLCVVVDDMKAAGWPPERTIIAVKQICSDAGLTESRAVLTLSNTQLDARDALVANLIRWTIERYYDQLQSS